MYCCFKYYFKREEEKVSVFGPISKGDFERNTLILRDERRAKMMYDDVITLSIIRRRFHRFKTSHHSPRAKEEDKEEEKETLLKKSASG